MPSFFKESKTNDFWLEKVIPLEPKHAMSSHVNNTSLQWYPYNSKRTKKKVYSTVSPAKLIPLTRKEAVIDHFVSSYPNKKNVYSSPNSNWIKKEGISVLEQPKTGSKTKEAIPISANTTRRVRNLIFNNYVALDNSYLDKCSKYLEQHQGMHNTAVNYKNCKNPENNCDLERLLYSWNTVSQCGDKSMNCREKSLSDSGIFVTSDFKPSEHPEIKRRGQPVKKGGEANKLNLPSEILSDALTKFLTAKRTEGKYPPPELTVQWLSTWAKCQQRPEAKGAAKMVKGLENKNNRLKGGGQMEKWPHCRSSLFETEMNNYIIGGGCQVSTEGMDKVCCKGGQFNCSIGNPCRCCCVRRKKRKKKKIKADPKPRNCRRVIISCLKGLVKKNTRTKKKERLAEDKKKERKAGCNQNKGCQVLCGIEATCPLGRKHTCRKISKTTKDAKPPMTKKIAEKTYAGMEIENIPAPPTVMAGAKQETLKNYELVLEGNAELLMAPDSDEDSYGDESGPRQFQSWTNIEDTYVHDSSLLPIEYSEELLPYSNKKSNIYQAKVPNKSFGRSNKCSDIHVMGSSLSQHISTIYNSEKPDTYSKCNDVVCRSKSPDESSWCNQKCSDIHVKRSNTTLSHHISTTQNSEKPHTYFKCNNMVSRSKSPHESSRCNKKCSDIHAHCSNPSTNLHSSKQSLPYSKDHHISCQAKLPDKSLQKNKKCNDMRPLIYQAKLSNKSFRYDEGDDFISAKSQHFPYVSYFPISALTDRAGFSERERNITEENNEQYHNSRVSEKETGKGEKELVKKRRPNTDIFSQETPTYSNTEPAAIKVLKDLLECVETEIDELEVNMVKYKTIGSNWGFEHAMSELRMKQKVLQNQIKKAVKEQKSGKAPICPHKDKQIFHFKQTVSRTDSESSGEAGDLDIMHCTERKRGIRSSREGGEIVCANKTPNVKASCSAKHFCEATLQSYPSVIGSACSLSGDNKMSDSDSDCDSDNSLTCKSIQWSDCVKYLLLSSRGVCKVKPLSTLDNGGD